ncbi:MAG: uracil phosphoribosyltransferase, partial [Oscillospiraceae bacterium]|nr:uracil phosphoribosyltransferase [Oscillospiraceae bacterium]
MHSNVTVFDHPLITHKISMLRSVDTSCKEFRELIEEIATMMGFEALRDLPLEEVDMTTPICKTKVKILSGKKLAIVP